MFSLELIWFRSNHQRCPINKADLKNFTTVTGKHICWNLFWIKLLAFRKLQIFQPYSGWGMEGKVPFISFSSVISTNAGISSKTFWFLLSTLLLQWCTISRLYLLPVPHYWTWPRTTPQTNYFVWSNSYKNQVMITSFIKMLELPNFGHMTISTI